MGALTRGVILVGHGGIPKDCPHELVMKLKRLEAQRRASKQPPSAEEIELDTKIRRWPRTQATDPYQSGLEAVAARLQAQLDGALFAVAYNEFCAPTLEEAVEALIKQGTAHITVTTTMFTPGGVTFGSRDSRDSRSFTATVSWSRTALCLALRPSAGRKYLGGAGEALFMKMAKGHIVNVRSVIHI